MGFGDRAPQRSPTGSRTDRAGSGSQFFLSNWNAATSNWGRRRVSGGAWLISLPKAPPDDAWSARASPELLPRTRPAQRTGNACRSDRYRLSFGPSWLVVGSGSAELGGARPFGVGADAGEFGVDVGWSSGRDRLSLGVETARRSGRYQLSFFGLTPVELRAYCVRPPGLQGSSFGSTLPGVRADTGRAADRTPPILRADRADLPGRSPDLPGRSPRLSDSASPRPSETFRAGHPGPSGPAHSTCRADHPPTLRASLTPGRTPPTPAERARPSEQAAPGLPVRCPSSGRCTLRPPGRTLPTLRNQLLPTFRAGRPLQGCARLPLPEPSTPCCRSEAARRAPAPVTPAPRGRAAVPPSHRRGGADVPRPRGSSRSP
ncbi:hypothetical protein DV517_67110 [Streptomyces sp. S816]|nr:hypothetical protein DV517_67110 [Streptomyces sp. S816]